MRRTRTIGTIWSRFRRRPIDTIAAAMAVVALVMRLATPAPGLLPSAATPDLTALFGEHALCLAAAAADSSSAEGRQSPAQPGHHADHECPGCCTGLVHAAGVLPRILGIRIDFVPLRIAVQAVEPPPQPLLRTRPAEPRGPPALG